MKLKTWLLSVDKTSDQFAAEINVSGASVRRYCNGRVPRPHIIARIRNATKGKVTANDFVDDDELAAA